MLARGVVCLGAVLGGPVVAHDFRLGPLRIDHPYALPTPPGAVDGWAYLRAIRNTGERPDRLVGAGTPIARAVEIHRNVAGAPSSAPRTRAIDGITLPAGADLPLRHDGEHHLVLLGLKRPLKEGEQFPLTLRFEHAGEREVTVGVQRPRAGAAADAARPRP